MKLFIASLIATTIIFVGAQVVSADSGNCSGQYGQYGGCTPSQSILIDKTVGKVVLNSDNSTSLQYVDNLTPSDPRFHAGDIMYFRVRVKNTSNATITNVTIKDSIPSFIEPMEGPGTYDGNARTVTWNAGDFAPSEEKVYTLKMQVDSAQYLPADKGLFCIINKAEASNGNVFDQDNAQFCIEKQVTGNVTQTPKAGPEFGLMVPLFGMIMGSVGIWIKRKV